MANVLIVVLHQFSHLRIVLLQHFPSINAYLKENKCLRGNYTEADPSKWYEGVSGKLDMCDRVCIVLHSHLIADS